MSDMEAGTVAKLFVNEFVVRYGAPACLHTDQGRKFSERNMQDVRDCEDPDYTLPPLIRWDD